MPQPPTVAITAADHAWIEVLSNVFRQAGWTAEALEFDDPAAGVTRVWRQRGHVDAWIYVPSFAVEALTSRAASWEPVHVLEEGSRAAWDIMRSQSGGGAIVVFISLEAVSTGIGTPSTAATHSALLSTVRAMAVAWARDSVRVNAILAPLGSAFERVHPTRFPLRRPPTLEDLAWPAVFLASSESSYVTAEAIRVDGGFLADQYL